MRVAEVKEAIRVQEDLKDLEPMKERWVEVKRVDTVVWLEVAGDFGGSL